MSIGPTHPWRTVELGQIASFISGGTPSRKTEAFFTGTIPWLTGYDIPEDQVTDIESGREYITDEAIRDSATNPVEAGTVLLTTRVTVGKVGVAATRLCFSQDITGIVIHDTRIISPVYLASYLLAIRELLLRKNRGSTIQGIIRRDLVRLPIPLPTPPEQQRIVDIMFQTEELRQLRRRADSKLKEIYHSIFVDMFTKALMSTKEMMLIRDLSTLVTSGSTPRGGEAVYVTEGPYFIRSQNVLMNELDLSDVVSITPDIHQSMIRTKVMNGDVLLNITGASIGRVAWVENLDHEANVNQHVCIIRPNQEKVLPEYLSIYISLPTTQEYIMATQAGASRQALNHQQVRKLKIYVPPLDQQEEFVKRVRVAREITNKPKEIISQLHDLLGSIIERAYSGNLTKLWREANSELLHDAGVEQSIALGERPKEPRLTHFETGEVTRAERERFEQRIHESFSPAVQQLAQSMRTSFQMQDLMQGPLLQLNEVIAPLAKSMAEMVNNSLARQMREQSEASLTALAAALQPLMQQIQAQAAEQISVMSSGLLNFAVQLSRLAAETSRQPDENNPRYYALAGLSDEQYWVCQAARRQGGYFTPESLSEAEGLPYDAIRTNLPLLETLGLITRVTVVVTPTKEEIYFVDAFRKPGETSETQAADLTYLKTTANQATGTV